MVILDRKPGEKGVIGSIISLTVPPGRADRVLIGIDAPCSISVLRADFSSMRVASSGRPLRCLLTSPPAAKSGPRATNSWSCIDGTSTARFATESEVRHARQ